MLSLDIRLCKSIVLKVLYLHIILGVQDLLRVRLHAAGVHHLGNSHNLCYHCVHVLPTKCRGLQMVRPIMLIQTSSILLGYYISKHWNEFSSE